MLILSGYPNPARNHQKNPLLPNCLGCLLQWYQIIRQSARITFSSELIESDSYGPWILWLRLYKSVDGQPEDSDNASFKENAKYSLSLFLAAEDLRLPRGRDTKRMMSFLSLGMSRPSFQRGLRLSWINARFQMVLVESPFGHTSSKEQKKLKLNLNWIDLPGTKKPAVADC